MLRIVLTNPENKMDYSCHAIIDTGASDCVFPDSAAYILGHVLEKGLKREVETARGKATAWAHKVCMEVNGYKVGPVLIDFIPGLKSHLIGVRSFLSKFILEIDYPNKKFSIYK